MGWGKARGKIKQSSSQTQAIRRCSREFLFNEADFWREGDK